MKTREERLAAMEARREKMRGRMVAQKAKRELKMAVAKMAPLEVLQPDPDAEVVEGIDSLEGMNEAVAKLADAKGIEEEKFSDDQKARIEDYRKGRERIDMIRQRQSDVTHYVVLCGMTGQQVDAFVRALHAKAIVPGDQDMFIDLRLIAKAMGIALPDPEYPMEYTPQKANGPSSRMEKIPRGYS